MFLPTDVKDFFVFSKLVPGRPLSQFFRKADQPFQLTRESTPDLELKLDERKRRRLILAVIKAFEAVLPAYHEAGKILSDIKPDNIIVSETQGDFHATLLDFGAIFKKNHSTTTPNGTLDYMAPEKFITPDSPSDSSVFSESDDIYAAALTLINIVTGEKDLFSEHTANAYLLKPLKIKQKINRLRRIIHLESIKLFKSKRFRHALRHGLSLLRHTAQWIQFEKKYYMELIYIAIKSPSPSIQKEFHVKISDNPKDYYAFINLLDVYRNLKLSIDNNEYLIFKWLDDIWPKDIYGYEEMPGLKSVIKNAIHPDIKNRTHDTQAFFQSVRSVLQRGSIPDTHFSAFSRSA